MWIETSFVETFPLQNKFNFEGVGLTKMKHVFLHLPLNRKGGSLYPLPPLTDKKSEFFPQKNSVCLKTT